MTVHTQYQHLKYSASQLFDLVADVERYPEFMPWLMSRGYACVRATPSSWI